MYPRFSARIASISLIRIRPVVITPCCSKSTSKIVQQAMLPPLDDKEASRVALKFAISHHRPNIYLRFIANCSNFYNLWKYRLFYDREFRMRPFRVASRSALAVVAAELHTKNFDKLKDLVRPHVIKQLKEKGDEMRQLPYLLAANQGAVLCEKLFSASFGTIAENSNVKRVFEITIIYICRLDQALVDRSKMMDIGKSNRHGGIDYTKGTLPVDAYLHCIFVQSLMKPLDKNADSDWMVTQYDPSLSFVPRKLLLKHI